MDEPFTMMVKGEAAEIPMIIVSSLFLVTIGDIILDSSIFRYAPYMEIFLQGTVSQEAVFFIYEASPKPLSVSNTKQRLCNIA